MRIKLKSAIAGHRFAHASGDIIDWDDAEAQRFIEAGIAEAVGDSRSLGRETAEQGAARRAEKR